ncbi:MAG TPA: cytochrome P460 family protein, partial [Steroidobacteraceae bacterium]|nr:cytochrome P460 family protein [Steroidobacteraceae bacterium]
MSIVLLRSIQADVRRSGNTKQTVGVLTMNGRSMLIVAAMALVLAILCEVAISAQDKYTLRVPDGLAFSDFKGYEDWQLISSAKTDDRMKVILGNPTIIAAYKSGIPGNGKPFPDGSKIAKVQWKPKKSTEAPF